ncbi:hypothetical protein ACFV0C_24830 [Streptomyces sp. NPDC059568]|uniref:hypothetical protein n=1 Tax=Streptomyces sp. NPDC059568 TaxID=3346868 RepID=UPI0036C4F56C
MTMRRVLGTALLGLALAGGASVPAHAAPATAAAPSKCATLYTADGSGRISICWTWTKHAQGGGYYGSYSGNYYDSKRDGKNLVLQAHANELPWVAVAAAQDGANGQAFAEDYTHLSGLTFRACLNSGTSSCGSAPS